MTPTREPPGDGSSDDDIEGFDDFPETYLEDEDYDEFLRKEFDAEGRVKGDPPVGWAIGLAIVLLGLILVYLCL